jgi:hypothetical protein
MTEKDLKNIVKELKKIVKQNNWENAGVSYIQRELKGRFNRALGFGLLWVIAKNHLPPREFRLKTVIGVMQEEGVSRSQAYDSRRAAEVILAMMKDKIIWEWFSEKYLSTTSLFRLYFLKKDLKAYNKSARTNTDRDSLIESVKEIHKLTREEFYSKYKKGSKRSLKGRIKKIRGKEIVIKITGVSKKGQGPAVGSKVTTTFNLKKSKNR